MFSLLIIVYKCILVKSSMGKMLRIPQEIDNNRCFGRFPPCNCAIWRYTTTYKTRYIRRNRGRWHRRKRFSRDRRYLREWFSFSKKTLFLFALLHIWKMCGIIAPKLFSLTYSKPCSDRLNEDPPMLHPLSRRERKFRNSSRNWSAVRIQW